jgi:2-keto-4-pentenoate hydratase/2-oxohepta-3-ene-1,7-dioic acid hydratase in catechol pathway
MRVCRFDDDRLGVVIGDKVHDVTAAQDKIRAGAPYAMKGDAVIAALPAWRARLEEMAPGAPGQLLSQVKLLAPVARPSKVMAAPTNYKKHIEEMRAVRESQTAGVSRFPSDIGAAGIFLKANSAIVGPSEGIPLRFSDRRNDHEVELVLIIGRQGSDISREHALDYVAGYCLGLDMTLRGQEDRSFRKSCDGYAVLGPWMATPDEISNPDDLPLSLHVNEQLRQDTNTKNLIYDVRRLIEFASSFYTLYPGDVYFTGTPEGVGPVKAGDWIRAQSAAPLGELRVQVRTHHVGRNG